MVSQTRPVLGEHTRTPTMISQVLVPLTLVGVAWGSRDFNVKRQVTELRDRYDFIIAGGGTTGLTVADRLTAAFPDRKYPIMTVELGMRVANGMMWC